MNYRTVRTLRRDARGEVLLVERSEASSTDYFLLTRLPAELSHRPEASQAFAAVLQQAMELRHPNLARVIAPTAPMAFVHEFTGGIDLATLLQALEKGGLSLPPDCALAIALQVAHGLAYLHGYQDSNGRVLQLVHGDVLPERIGLGLHGEVKLGEMVSAATHRAGGHQPPWIEATLDHHFSPEQLAGEPLDPRSDVYSLGLLTWKLFANRTPRGRTIARLDHVIDRFPKGIADLVARALAPERDLRFASALGFAEALGDAAASWAKPATAATLAQWFSRYAMLQVADELPDQTLPGVMPPPRPLHDTGTLETLVDQPKPKRWPWPLLTLAGLASVAATSAWWFLRQAPIPAPIVADSQPSGPVVPASQPTSLPVPPPAPLVVRTPAVVAGSLVLTTNTRATYYIDGKKVAAQAVRLELSLPSGRHLLRVLPKSKRLQPLERAVEVVAGQRLVLELELKPKKKQKR